ncbi:hypothetical protein SAMN05216235_2019 [Salinicoccus halodurans]|uniref:Uncharacterized protein n=1 Tax=Salinicoccus halodurans TaxID=407035 RepID=A0AA94HGE7_9STAP|nr:hypothetical protein SAMN05216235_2019 [Salinicoccus halodurans]
MTVSKGTLHLILSPIQTLTVGFRLALNQPHRKKTVRVAGSL